LHFIISQRFLRIERPIGVIGEGSAQRAPCSRGDLEMRQPGNPARQPAGSLATWVPGLAHLELPAGERRPLSVALFDSAIWTFDSQKPLRYDEVQALYVQPAAAEERRRKAP